MKRLIELESMAPEQEKKNAKCFVCQKYSPLKVCNDYSYMLCRFGKCDFFDRDAGNEGIFKKVFDFRKIKALLKYYELIKDFESYKEIEDI